MTSVTRRARSRRLTCKGIINVYSFESESRSKCLYTGVGQMLRKAQMREECRGRTQGFYLEVDHDRISVAINDVAVCLVPAMY